MGNLQLLCLVINVCKGTARRPRYEYSITSRWKFCSRFINSRPNAQYLPSYRVICFLVFWSTCAISLKRLTFAISSPDEFLSYITHSRKSDRWSYRIITIIAASIFLDSLDRQLRTQARHWASASAWKRPQQPQTISTRCTICPKRRHFLSWPTPRSTNNNNKKITSLATCK